ncbi:MAG: urease accessory protein UreD [Hyphomicrobiales bacterium]
MTATFERSTGGATHVASLEEAGGYRMRFARVHARSAPCEGAIINTGGGMAGGDRLCIAVEAKQRSNLLLSTPAAERIYHSTGSDTEIDIALRLEAGSRLAWLPQETILFSGARLARRLVVDMDESATLILAEATIFGRGAMGETLGRGLFADRWRIRRNGRLLHAEETRLEGPIADLLARRAIGNGAGAVATAVMVSPQVEDRLDAVRATLPDAACECGASAWNGMLVGRFLAKEPRALHADLVRFLLTAMQGRLPRLWTAAGGVAMRRSAAEVGPAAPSMPEGEGDMTREAEVEPDPA